MGEPLKMEIVHILWAGPFYKYKGWYLEDHRFMGPVAIKKNGDERRVGANSKFWDLATEFARLPKNEKEKYRVAL